MSTASPYRSVVFAGGGNRSIWQAGFWEVAAEPLGLAPEIVAATSAGACMAAMVFSGTTRRSLENFKRVTAGNERNAYWRNLLNDQPVFPQPTLFRRAVMQTVQDGDLERLQQGPELRVLMARPPRWAGPKSGVALGFLCYLLEKHLVHPLHPRLPAKVGFEPEVALANECQSVDELINLLMATSCTPPVVPVMHWGGGPVLDGGLIDNAPVAAVSAEEAPTLVLLTRRYPADRLHGHPGRTYIQPSKPVRISKWDYTDPQGMQDVFDLGRHDAELFIAGGPAALQR